MIGLDFLWTVGFFSSSLLKCYPLSVNWTGLGWQDGKCINVNLMFWTQAWSDVATNGKPSLAMLLVFGSI